MDRVDDEMIVGENSGRGGEEGWGKRNNEKIFSIVKYKWDGHDIENQAIVVLPQEVLSSWSTGINRGEGEGERRRRRRRG